MQSPRGIAQWLLSCVCVVAATSFVETKDLHALEVRCIPWLGHTDWRQDESPRFYHRTWQGHLVSLKGAVRYEGEIRWEWDFGNGQTASGTQTATLDRWVPIGPPGADGTVNPVYASYSGPDGEVFIARLTVTAGESEIASDEYPIVLMPHQRPRTDPAWVDSVEIDVMIEEALWWLYRNAIHGHSEAGDPTVRWAENYFVANTGAAVQAFERSVHLPLGDPSEDPYVELVRRGIDYLLLSTQRRAIPHAFRGFDSNDNEIGLTCFRGIPTKLPEHPAGWRAMDRDHYPEMYEIGWALMAFVSSDAPGLKAKVGSSSVRDRSLRSIVQDLVDYCGYAQNGEECPEFEGGWRYKRRFCELQLSRSPELRYGRPWSDDSATQWPIIGMWPAATLLEWDAQVPTIVKERLRKWLLRPQPNAAGGYGYPYVGEETWANVAKTAGTGITGLRFVGLDERAERMRSAIDFIVREWNTPRDSWSGSTATMNIGNIYAMYGVKKAFDGEFLGREALSDRLGHDWYREYAWHLLHGTKPPVAGHWEGEGSQFSDALWTSLATLILTPGVLDRPPVAILKVHGRDSSRVEIGQPVVLDASLSVRGSFPIRAYQFDFDGDGTWDLYSEQPTVSTVFQTALSDPYCNPYAARVRVIDARNELSSKASLHDDDTCEVFVHPPPHPPVAVIQAPSGSFTTCVGAPLELTGAASFDPNSTDAILAWTWEIDGELVQCGGQQCGTISVAGNEPGSHVVRLVVESWRTADGLGPRPDTACGPPPADYVSEPVFQTIHVVESPTPVATIYSLRGRRPPRSVGRVLRISDRGRSWNSSRSRWHPVIRRALRRIIERAGVRVGYRWRWRFRSQRPNWRKHPGPGKRTRSETSLPSGY